MTHCAAPRASGAPCVALTLVGSGEPLLRLEKRLACAAGGLGLALKLDICKDAETLGIPHAQTPALLAEGTIVFTGLPRTEAIEAWLRERIPT